MQVSTETIYLTGHAVITLGALITLLLRIESRTTRLETKMEYIEKKLP